MFIKSLLGMSTLFLSMTLLNAAEVDQKNITQDKIIHNETKAISAHNAIATWQQKLSDEGYFIGEIDGLSSPELNRATKGYLRDRI